MKLKNHSQFVKPYKEYNLILDLYLTKKSINNRQSLTDDILNDLYGSKKIFEKHIVGKSD